MIRTQIQLDPGQLQWLRAEAQKKGVSVSSLVREAATLFQEREQKTASEKKERALAAVGRFASDAPDVSERHDAYLADAYREKGEPDA